VKFKRGGGWAFSIIQAEKSKRPGHVVEPTKGYMENLGY